jgi:hypothetical protein
MGEGLNFMTPGPGFETELILLLPSLLHLQQTGIFFKSIARNDYSETSIKGHL